MLLKNKTPRKRKRTGASLVPIPSNASSLEGNLNLHRIWRVARLTWPRVDSAKDNWWRRGLCQARA